LETDILTKSVISIFIHSNLHEDAKQCQKLAQLGQRQQQVGYKVAIDKLYGILEWMVSAGNQLASIKKIAQQQR